MSDEVDVNPEEEAKDDDAAGGGKKPATGLLPKLLKFIAIGLGALVFIVTVTMLTVNIMNKGGKSQTVVPLTDSYAAVKKQYSMFTLIGTIVTRTRDPTPKNISVDIIIGYDLNNTAAATELTSRLYELRDSVRNYFSGKSASELQPENEARIKNEIRERLNTTVLDKARIRIILFDKLDLYDME
ncbi:MAG: flagellar basal body-associated FliL family protein [Spirochaetaceae bacterium]|jgi:flagellar FliL protein|nr:flagellar basal body-associated FliL family protein [Spirochaetaceae bacterium]